MLIPNGKSIVPHPPRTKFIRGQRSGAATTFVELRRLNSVTLMFIVAPREYVRESSERISCSPSELFTVLVEMGWSRIWLSCRRRCCRADLRQISRCRYAKHGNRRDKSEECPAIQFFLKSLLKGDI